MKEYTAKQIRQLEKNPYVFKVTKYMIYYTAKFKEDFWVSYQAGNTPRKILEDFGFDLSIFQYKTNRFTCAAHKKASPGWGGIF